MEDKQVPGFEATAGVTTKPACNGSLDSETLFAALCSLVVGFESLVAGEAPLAAL